MSYRVFLSLVAGMSLLVSGCNKDSSSSGNNISVGKRFAIDPADRRPSTIFDRLEEEQGNPGSPQENTLSTSTTSAGASASRGGGLFAFGSSGIDDLQAAAQNINVPLDLRLLELDTLESAYKVQFDRGEELLRRGQYDQALICFDEAKTINAKYYQAYVGEAFAYYRKGNFGRASAAINQAIRVAQHVPVLYNHRAHISAQLGDYRTAVDDLSHLLKMQPEDISSLLSRAQFQAQLKNHAAAASDYTAALKLRPNDANVLLQRSVSYYQLGKYKESVADASAVIEQRRDQFDPYFVRAAARANLNDVSGGKSDYDEAVKLGLPPKIAEMWRPRFYANEPNGSGS